MWEIGSTSSSSPCSPNSSTKMCSPAEVKKATHVGDPRFFSSRTSSGDEVGDFLYWISYLRILGVLWLGV